MTALRHTRHASSRYFTHTSQSLSSYVGNRQAFFTYPMAPFAPPCSSKTFHQQGPTLCLYASSTVPKHAFARAVCLTKAWRLLITTPKTQRSHCDHLPPTSHATLATSTSPAPTLPYHFPTFKSPLSSSGWLFPKSRVPFLCTIKPYALSLPPLVDLPSPARPHQIP